MCDICGHLVASGYTFSARGSCRTRWLPIENRSCCAAWVSANCAFPYANHSPTLLLRQRGRSCVPLPVSTHLLFPKLSVRPRERCLPAVGRTGVPVVAIDEDSDSVPGQDDVRSTTRRDASVKSEPRARCVQSTAKQDLGLGVDLLPSAKVPPFTRRSPARAQGQPCSVNAAITVLARSGGTELPSCA